MNRAQRANNEVRKDHAALSQPMKERAQRCLKISRFGISYVFLTEEAKHCIVSLFYYNLPKAQSFGHLDANPNLSTQKSERARTYFLVKKLRHFRYILIFLNLSILWSKEKEKNT